MSKIKECGRRVWWVSGIGMAQRFDAEERSRWRFSLRARSRMEETGNNMTKEHKVRWGRDRDGKKIKGNRKL